jgi:hypothetical protein
MFINSNFGIFFEISNYLSYKDLINLIKINKTQQKNYHEYHDQIIKILEGKQEYNNYLYKRLNYFVEKK